ncbi:MAG: 5-methyltetrahydropteroyltriglutamate--homocysteine S-methyltransferase [Angustibacter sp.]
MPPPAVGATTLGWPRVGRDRALKKLTERHWAGRISGTDLIRGAGELRRDSLALLRDTGLTEVPCNDFSLYDHVLDTACLVGAIPTRHRGIGGARPGTTSEAGLAGYFAMARGTDAVAPLELTKWFDTNYHYLVPELGPDSTFSLDPAKPLAELALARAEGVTARPVLVGPVTFLLLAKAAPDADPGFEPLSLLENLLPVYTELLGRLQAAGAAWVQLDEPALVQDQPPAVLDAARQAYDRLGGLTARPKLLVASYFDVLGAALPVLRGTPVDGLALDLTGPAAGNLEALAEAGSLPGKRLVAGVIDGRNIWVNDLRSSLSALATLLGMAEEVVVAPSCSLLHVPLDVTVEADIEPRLASWFAFARQKVEETVVLARGLNAGVDAIRDELACNETALAARSCSPITSVPAVRARMATVTADDTRRRAPYPDRARAQRERLALPPLPTTTIGSFPQTAALRESRSALRRGEIDAASYQARMRAEIEHVIGLQERLGLDVLVHGEPERSDMVQYFAEQLDGFLATQHGWVQSYGTRYVRPPIVVGDVSRPEPMTVAWATYAQTLTERPVKGMLTGPVTLLAWSFVRDDQPLADTARQVALTLRDEVGDLEAAGIAIIQVDEPALRETLPLRVTARADYLRWATEAFRLATSGVRDDTQIHTHMCYAEFGDILPAIIDLDTDVISMEAARSHMAIAADLSAAAYPSGVGPGVYDIHSPRVPPTDEVTELLRAALAHVPADRLWVNPDCGLKTRTEDEVVRALERLTAAAATLR